MSREACSSSGRKRSIITAGGVRLAWPLMFSAAMVWPVRSTMGAASEPRPSSSSWSTTHQPWRRVCSTSATSASSSTTVREVQEVRSREASRARASSGGRPASSTRPIEVH